MSVPCEECQQLTLVYMSALARKAEVEQAAATLKSVKLRIKHHEEAQALQTACENALAELNRHREEHGC